MFNLTNLCGFMAYTDAVSGGTGAGPGGGDPFWDDVVWYFRFDGGLVDQKGNLTLAQVATRFASDGPYGLGEKCLETNYAYATPSYVSKSTGTVDIGTGDYTIECWFKIDPLFPTTEHWLWENSPGAPASGAFSYVFTSTDQGLLVGTTKILKSLSLYHETWYWIVFQREAGTTSVYLNGILQGETVADATNILYFSTGRGAGADPSNYIRIAEHRGTKRARYSGATIPVPTAPFPTT